MSNDQTTTTNSTTPPDELPLPDGYISPRKSLTEAPDGNVFSIIAFVRRALSDAGNPTAVINEYTRRAQAGGGYDMALRVSMAFIGENDHARDQRAAHPTLESITADAIEEYRAWLHEQDAWLHEHRNRELTLAEAQAKAAIIAEEQIPGDNGLFLAIVASDPGLLYYTNDGYDTARAILADGIMMHIRDVLDDEWTRYEDELYDVDDERELTRQRMYERAQEGGRYRDDDHDRSRPDGGDPDYPDD